MDKIILYAMRGSGKSTIGKSLATELGTGFIDLDAYLEEKAGEKINIFVEKNGWDAFRNLEHECLKEVINQKGKYVISLGGGTIVFDRNIEELNKINDKKLIFIETDLEIIAKRIEKDEKEKNIRPSLTGKGTLEELKEVYLERESIYKENADEIVNNNGSIENTINSIKKVLSPEKSPFGELKNKICIPIVNFEEKYLKETYEKLKDIKEIEYVELRIDFLEKINNLENIIKSCPKKTVLTNRIKNEGGNFEGSYEETFEIQKKSLNTGAFLIDLELQTIENINIPEINKSKLILSNHDFEKTPKLEELIEVLKRMEKFDPKIYKIAVTPNTKNDIKIIYDLTSYFKENYKNKDFIFISMGELGMETRENIPKLGGYLTFASFGGKISAPGQIDYKDLYEKICK